MSGFRVNANSNVAIFHPLLYIFFNFLSSIFEGKILHYDSVHIVLHFSFSSVLALGCFNVLFLS